MVEEKARFSPNAFYAKQIDYTKKEKAPHGSSDAYEFRN